MPDPDPKTAWTSVWLVVANQTGARALRAASRLLLDDVFAKIQPPGDGVWSRNDVGVARAVGQELHRA